MRKTLTITPDTLDMGALPRPYLSARSRQNVELYLRQYMANTGPDLKI